MNAHDERALRYRQRAEELRAMLPDMVDNFTRDTLENIAIGYDHLAKVQDDLAKMDKTAIPRIDE